MAVMSTGDELMEPNASQLGEGKIRDANRPMLLAAASAAGCKVRRPLLLPVPQTCLAHICIPLSAPGCMVGPRFMPASLPHRRGHA